MVNRLSVSNGTIVLPDRCLDGYRIDIRGDRISEILTASAPSLSFDDPSDGPYLDASGGYIVPGYVDIHVHGGGGYDFMDGSPEAVTGVCQTHLKHGTTSIFPTTTTGSADQIAAMLASCQQAKSTGVGARISGVHLYGPYFAEDKVGCPDALGRRSPVAEEYLSYFASGLIKIATCAAELPGAEAFYRAAAAANCLVTCGHSNASWQEMQRAFEAGMRHVDHFWCAMSSVASLRQRFGVPMQASMNEFVLMQPEMSTEVIADGQHLSAELLEFAYRMKGPERLCLVTDCNRALDCASGRYRFGNCDTGTWFESDGRAGWGENGSLASSCVGMDHMVRHFLASTSAECHEVIRMATLTPAERTGIAELVGSIEVGKLADLLVLDRDWQVQRVVLAGRIIDFSD